MYVRGKHEKKIFAKEKNEDVRLLLSLPLTSLQDSPKVLCCVGNALETVSNKQNDLPFVHHVDLAR